MADPTLPQVTRSYLTQLDRALASVPVEVRDEIVAGIREELIDLDAAAAAARIEVLGDPEFIAAEARAEAGVSDPALSAAGHAEAPASPSGEPGWYPVIGALLISFGGLVVPLFGWVAGLGMMWASKTWRVRDKWVATLTPFVAVALFILVFALTTVAAQPSTSDQPNPLIPGMFSVVWSSAVLVIPVNVVVGIWLLWRAKQASVRREARPLLQPQATVPRRPQASWYAPVTLLLIIGGGFVVPVIGWVAGVIMLWAADIWSVRDKWLGTLAGPIALLISGAFWLGVVLWMRTAGGAIDPFMIIALSALVLPTVANVLVGIRLLRRRDQTEVRPAE